MRHVSVVHPEADKGDYGTTACETEQMERGEEVVSMGTLEPGILLGAFATLWDCIFTTLSIL